MRSVVRSMSEAREPNDGTALFEHLVEAVGCYRTDGTIVYVNPVACRVLGRSREELVGQNLWDVAPEAREGPFRVAFEQVVRSGAAQPLETFHAQGARWFSIQIYLTGEKIWVLGRDVTAEKATTARIEILATASRVFSQATPSDAAPVFPRIARHVAELLHDLCSVRLLSADGARFEQPVGIWDTDPQIRRLLDDTPAAGASEAIGAEILRTRRSVIIAHIDPGEAAARIAPSPRRELVERLGIHSAMIAPLQTQGELLGIVSVCRRLTGTRAAYVDADLEILEDLADRAAMVVGQWRALRRAEESHQRLLLIGDALPALVSLVGKDGRYQFVNAAYETWFGGRRADFIGKAPEEVLGPAAYAPVEPYIRRALAGEAVTYEAKVPYERSGERGIRATYTPYRVGGQVEGFIGLVLDVTDRMKLADEREALLLREHRARQEAERSEQRLRRMGERTDTIMSNAALGLLMMDDRQHCTFMNPAAERITGFRLDELRGKPLHHFIHHSHSDGAPYPIEACPINRALPTKNQQRGEDTFIHKDGHFYPVAFTASPILDGAQSVGTVIELRDTTEEKAAQRERERILADLRAAVAARDEFLSIASHELRTPLTSLDLHLANIRRSLLKEPAEQIIAKLRGRIESAARQADRLKALIDGLLNVSRIELGRLHIEPAALDVADLVREVVERCEADAARVGSAIATHLPPQVATVWADRMRIDQALTNLLSNAIKYGAGKPIEVRLAADGGQLSLAVRDEGMGIAPQDLARIFGRFERAVASTHYGGLGLGLYIANQIVIAHGGAIDADSEPGKGATFTIRLPLGLAVGPADPLPDPPPG